MGSLSEYHRKVTVLIRWLGWAIRPRSKTYKASLADFIPFLIFNVATSRLSPSQQALVKKRHGDHQQRNQQKVNKERRQPERNRYTEKLQSDKDGQGEDCTGDGQGLFSHFKYLL
jgi:hypothetical protein